MSLSLVFAKPKNSRDRGLIRLCSNHPSPQIKVQVITSVKDYIENELLLNKKRGIIPIMYLSEWKTSPDEYKKYCRQCICRGFPRLQIVSQKGNIANILNAHFSKNEKRLQDLIHNRLFFPRTWVLPSDQHLFLKENKLFCSQTSKSSNSDLIQYIIKPQGL